VNREPRTVTVHVAVTVIAERLNGSRPDGDYPQANYRRIQVCRVRGFAVTVTAPCTVTATAHGNGTRR
jgi:hypothetical protein